MAVYPHGYTCNNLYNILHVSQWTNHYISVLSYEYGGSRLSRPSDAHSEALGQTASSYMNGPLVMKRVYHFIYSYKDIETY